MAEKKPFLINAESRCLVAAYGLPPFVSQPSEEIGMNTPICTPSREDTTVADWYAEQERVHGKIAEAKAKRPKTGWSWGKKSEAQEEQESLQLPARQQPQLTVQQQLRQRLQLTDNSNATPTETENGILWFTIEKEKVSKW